MTTSGTVLIVDDEDDLRNLLDLHFTREGFTTKAVALGGDALSLAATHKPSVILLDLMLPDMSGTEVCRQLRAMPETRDIPIIMLTARGEEIDRVVGFEVGADDYVVKSNLSVRELVLRVRAVVRRRTAASESAQHPSEPVERLTFGSLTVDIGSHRVWVDASEVQLTATEFKLLTTLAMRPGRVFTRGALLQDVWDMPPDMNTRTVDTHIKRLREKLNSKVDPIETVRGVGYRFNAEAG